MLTIEQDLKIKAWDEKLREMALSKVPDCFTSRLDLPPISIWKRLWWKIKYPFEFRITHKDNIGDSYY